MKGLYGILVLTLVAGCGGTAATPLPSTVGADLKEFSITLDAATAAAGQVTFRLKNSGTIVHEFIVVRSDLEPDALPVEGGIVPEEGLDVIGEQEDIPVGSTMDLSLALPAGHYILFCNIEGHYAGGMRSEITTR